MTESSTTATQAAPAPIITISNVWKYFGSLPALQDVSLDVATGERVVIIGPSGSGKSTLLRSINRLEEIDQGSIVVKGQNIMSPDNDINLVRQNLGMVFQQFNLFPHKTVLENLTLAPIKLRKLSREEAESRALGLLKKVGISDKANVYPAGSNSVWPLLARSPCSPISCCSTNPLPPLIRKWWVKCWTLWSSWLKRV